MSAKQRFHHSGLTVMESNMIDGLGGQKKTRLKEWYGKPFMLNGGMVCHTC